MPEDPSPAASGQHGGTTSVADLRLTDTQRKILLALCRPCMGEGRYATPATNQEIAAEVFLSVDAIKAHLRALYRKFGVEPLPQNQKRARLVELVLEGGLVSPEQLREPPPSEPAPPPPGPRDRRHRGALIASIALGALGAAVALALILSGGSGEEPGEAPASKAEYVAAVDRYCSLALGRPEQARGSSRGDAATAERARTYLGVIETMRGRLESLTPPAGEDRALERYRAGLQRAADFTSVVAEEPPRPGSRESARVVAELTLAAGQVQAGALGYGLGSDCAAIGDLVADSARNAARAP
jgi:hypothetical protein